MVFDFNENGYLQSCSETRGTSHHGRQCRRGSKASPPQAIIVSVILLLSIQLAGFVSSTDGAIPIVKPEERQIKGDSSRAQVLDNPDCGDEIPSRCEGNRTPLTDLEALNCILNQKVIYFF